MPHIRPSLFRDKGLIRGTTNCIPHAKLNTPEQHTVNDPRTLEMQ